MPVLDLGYTPVQKAMFFPEEEKRFNIFPCGRRLGKTQGAAHACIEWAVQGMPILWGDTINANIERYWDRYFDPALKDSGIEYHFNKQSKVARIGRGYIDFRSADNPSNWEGFGYRKIVLNEAGIILGDLEGNKGPYLYAAAVLPMMIDHDESQLYALGVPKGKMLKSGEPHPFYTLWQRVGVEPNYRGAQYATSEENNPLLTQASINELADEITAMSPEKVPQEIGGQFIDRAGNRPFAFNFKAEAHKKPCVYDPKKRIIISVDFNRNPFCCVFAHIWTDGVTHHCHVFAEESIKDATLDEMATRIRSRIVSPLMIEMTGDRNGMDSRLNLKSNASMFDDLLRLLGMPARQLTIKANPSHIQSREDCNYVLANLVDLKIDPSCTGLIRDLQSVEVDEDGEIIKKNRDIVTQQADLLDAFRYMVNSFLWDFIKSHKRAVSIRSQVR